MRNFKKVFCIVLFVIVGLFAFAQSERIGNADVVVLLDTSGGILQYYDDINDRVLTEIINKFVRKGDNVHVLSFNADARYEMSQKINSEKDLSRVVSRFLLMYQLGRNSDFLTGLDYCKSYTAKLQKNDEQILVVISDGIFNPPAWSPYKNYNDQQVKNRIDLLAGNIRKEGWKVYYVKLPYPSDAVIRNLNGEEFYSDENGKLSRRNNTSGQNSSNASNNSNSSNNSNGSSNSNGNANSNSNNSTDSSNSSANANSNNSNSDSDDYNDDEYSDDLSNSSNNGGDAVGGNNSNGGDNSDNADSENGDDLTDVSDTFEESAGAAKTELPKDKDEEFAINENMKYYPIVNYPDSLTADGTSLSFDLQISNSTDEAVELELEKISLDNGIKIDEIDASCEKISLNPEEEMVVHATATLPKEYTEGNYNVLMSLQFKDGKKVFPQAAELSLSVFPTTAQQIFSSDNLLYWIIGAIILLLLIILIIFLIRRSSSSSSNNVIRSANANLYDEDPKAKLNKNEEEDDHAKRLSAFTASTAASSKVAGAGTGSSIYSADNKNRVAAQSKEDAIIHEKILKGAMSKQQPRGTYMAPANHMEKIEIKRNKSGKSEIYVLHQNRSIGKRNIHVMKAGTRLSVGGGKSDDFLIFLVPFPSRLAQVRYDGEDYHLAILKPEYFPYETSNVVNNCIGKTITAVSDKGYHVYFTFRDYEDPAEKLNDILTSINYE